MIANAEVGQWVKLSKSRIVSGRLDYVVAPAGTECEVIAKENKGPMNATYYDVKILGTENDVITCCNFDELDEMTLAEIGASIFFTF